MNPPQQGTKEGNTQVNILFFLGRRLSPEPRLFVGGGGWDMVPEETTFHPAYICCIIRYLYIFHFMSLRIHHPRLKVPL